jgi:hypothetical protein
VKRHAHKQNIHGKGKAQAEFAKQNLAHALLAAGTRNFLNQVAAGAAEIGFDTVNLITPAATSNRQAALITAYWFISGCIPRSVCHIILSASGFLTFHWA